jgi:hypothetical protein
MSKSIFISCVHEDSHRIAAIQKWANEGRLGNVIITMETEDKRYQGKEAIKAHIREKIRGASFVMVLVGNDTHNHAWIDAEVELANSFHKPIFGIRIPNTLGTLPPLLKKYALINFDPESVKRVLDNF